MSRQLESLRSRELWLLNQVDLVSSAKNEVLRQQRETINELCSKIDSIVQHKNVDESMLPTLLTEYVYSTCLFTSYLLTVARLL